MLGTSRIIYSWDTGLTMMLIEINISWTSLTIGKRLYFSRNASDTGNAMSISEIIKLKEWKAVIVTQNSRWAEQLWLCLLDYRNEKVSIQNYWIMWFWTNTSVKSASKLSEDRICVYLDKNTSTPEWIYCYNLLIKDWTVVFEDEILVQSSSNTLVGRSANASEWRNVVYYQDMDDSNKWVAIVNDLAETQHIPCVVKETKTTWNSGIINMPWWLAYTASWTIGLADIWKPVYQNSSDEISLTEWINIGQCTWEDEFNFTNKKYN